MNVFNPETLVPNPLSERVIDLMVALIAQGRLLPGQRITELELAKRFGTSRAPVREALRTLETQGIMESAPHRGTYVKPFNALHIARVAEARYALELLSVRDAMERLKDDPDLATELEPIIQRMKVAVAAEDRFKLNEADIDFHRQICLISQNEIVTKLWDAIAKHVLIAFGLMTDRYPDSDDIVRQHFELRDFLIEGKVADLPPVLAAHVGGLQREEHEHPHQRGGFRREEACKSGRDR